MIEVISALVGGVLPPAIRLVRDVIFRDRKSSQYDNIYTLATESPQHLPEYVKALADLVRAEKELFNKDVSGEIPRWVAGLRAAIRPMVVILSFVVLIIDFFSLMDAGAGVRAACTGYIGAWMGDRVKF